MEKNISSGDVRNLFTLAIQAVFSVEPRDVSFLHFLFYIHSGGNLNALLSVTRGAQESRFSGGSQAIANKMAEELGERVVLNAPVHTIGQDNTGVLVESDAVVIPMDPPKVERIVENLVANAAKHTSSDSGIWVRVVQERGGALIVVEDDGAGVPEELRDDIAFMKHLSGVKRDYRAR